jgi:hypothetical protein
MLAVLANSRSDAKAAVRIRGTDRLEAYSALFGRGPVQNVEDRGVRCWAGKLGTGEEARLAIYHSVCSVAPSNEMSIMGLRRGTREVYFG